MTEQEARKSLQGYQEIDDDTGEKYGYIIQESCGKDGEGYIFRCKVEGVDYSPKDNLPLLGVYPDGTVISIPI